MSARPLRRRMASDLGTMHFGPNMTPMVDVVMVILVFFMVSAAFLGPEWLLGGLVPKTPPAQAGAPTTPGAGAPKGADPLATAPVRFVIVLRGNAAGTGVLATGAGMTDATIEGVMEALAARVGTAADQIEVLIKADAGVPWSAVVRVHELAQRLGVRRVGPQMAAPSLPASPAPVPIPAQPAP